jgi:hypothetical protein
MTKAKRTNQSIYNQDCDKFKLKLQKKELKFLSYLYTIAGVILLVYRNTSSDYQDHSIHVRVTRLVVTLFLIQLLKRVKINSIRTLNIINGIYLIGISLMLVQNAADIL